MSRSRFHSLRRTVVLAFILIVLCSACIHASGLAEAQEQTQEQMQMQAQTQTQSDSRTVRILATSDIHGKFYPYLYAQNREDLSGSLAQIATAVKQYRTENTLLVDCGDSIQANSADIFIGEEVHPVIAGLNEIGYDIWVTGNHEYDYGMEVLRRTIASFDGKVLTGNVYYENGEPIADGYTIVTIDGIRIALIGMVTPYIQFWNDKNLAGCKVSDPVEETRRIIDSIQGQYDLLVGTMHMDIVRDYDYPNSSVRELAMACPEFDIIIASHGHDLIEGELINGVLVVENKKQGGTMSVIDITLEQSGEGWAASEVRTAASDISAFEPDSEFMEALHSYHEAAVIDAEQVVAYFDGDILVEESEIAVIPSLAIRDSALVDLINTVQMYYGEAEVSATDIKKYKVQIYRGDIRKCDMSKIYSYSNTLDTYRMTGRQLKVFMEWSVSNYNRYKEGDLTVSFDPNGNLLNYYAFSGVNYEVDISKKAGERICKLTWPDGRPVGDDDEFIIAVSNFTAMSLFSGAGCIFKEGDVPELLKTEIRSDLGYIQDMIRDYIVNQCNGVLRPICDNNWALVGNDWDEALHRQAVELVREGKLKVVCSEYTKVACEPITVQDLDTVSE